MHICVMFNMWLYFPTTIDNTQQTNCHTCLAVALLVTNISIPYSLGSRPSHLAVYLSTCSAWVSAHLFASLPGPACLAIQLGPLSVTACHYSLLSHTTPSFNICFIDIAVNVLHQFSLV